MAQESTAPKALRDLFDACGGADIVIANAGINGVTNVGQGDLAEETQIIKTNLIGGIITADAAIEHFLERRHGQLVGISSLASLQPIQQQAAYCASKAGFSMNLDSLRVELRKTKICVTDIRPGYISTDIVDGVDICKMPFAITPEKAAEGIPPRQTSCRLLTIPLKAALEYARGSIRTTIQRESGGTIAAAGEWCAGGRGA